MPFQKNNRRGGFKRARDGRKLNHHRKFNNEHSRKPKSEYRHKEQLTEIEIGISEYISDLEGYSGVIKARFSDFHVNEVNLEGNVAKLTTTAIPENFSFKVKEDTYEDIMKSPLEIIPQETWEALKKLATDEDEQPIILDADSFSKEERTNIHVCVKKHFGKTIVASTVTKDGKSCLEFKKFDKQAKESRFHWPTNTPEYVHFVVYKERMDTMEACSKIAKALRMSASKITYAGVKDRRAKTSQWLCVKRYEPSKILNKTKIIRNLRIGNFEFKTKCLKIGQLKGNRFRIALRNVNAENDLIDKSLEHVKEHGFINYYGFQRFGNDKDVPTFLIGIKLLQGQWKEAVNLILRVKSGDDPILSITEAKKLYSESGDASAALKLCEYHDNSLEKKLLEGLSKHHNNDYVNALESIPRNMRLMYIHSFQSLIWNKMVSKRLKEFGLKPVEGDLIFVNNSGEPVESTEEENLDDESEADEDKTDDSPSVKSGKPIVRALNADELDKYTIHDIVLPLPGFDITYPENMKSHYKQAIEECGLTLEMPQQKVRTYNLSGTYRNVCERVQDLEWKIMKYNDPTDNLIRSDLEELNGEEEPKSVEGGQFKAVVLSFTLNASAYATMVLRDVLKCNTSSSFQATCNNYAEEKNTVFELNGVQPGSLLANKEKYEDFKNNLFKDILGDTDESSSNKGELQIEEETESSCKKTRVDGDAQA